MSVAILADSYINTVSNLSFKLISNPAFHISMMYLFERPCVLMFLLCLLDSIHISPLPLGRFCVPTCTRDRSSLIFFFKPKMHSLKIIRNDYTSASDQNQLLDTEYMYISQLSNMNLLSKSVAIII
jgi:hypothetical protein